jgi:3-deoxy-manno-octulosonate cytidylyltransferase (CMP-KDO synthetase)
MTSCAILIPARWGSTRFEGKPLAELNGVPLIKRVYDICKSTGLDTYVLTDDQRIYNVVGPQCIIDRDPYENGTERCRGAHMKSYVNYEHYINVQGDMADVTPEIITAAINALDGCQVSTVYTEMPKEKQEDPNTVKMVRADNRALWFGRGMTGYGEWHLGIYGYDAMALEQYPKKISIEEDIEKLEQIRWLKNGWQIGCKSVQYNGVEINTPEDLEEWHAKQGT